MQFGTTFSNKYCHELGLDPLATFAELIKQLKLEAVRIPFYWDEIEANKGEFNFDYYQEIYNLANSHSIKITPALGRKVPRWPEYHVPNWADKTRADLMKNLNNWYEAAFNFINKQAGTVSIQIENEPLFAFGENKFLPTLKELKQEIAIVRSLTELPLITSASSQFKNYKKLLKLVDRVGVNIYEVVYDANKESYRSYNHPQKFYNKIAKRSENIFVAELQAEPWGTIQVKDMVKSEWSKSCNPDLIKGLFAKVKAAGFSETWFWGCEWWIYLKQKREDASIIETINSIIINNAN